MGFPEIRLNIFPGLGGTQRMPRRSGLVNPNDPMNGDAGFTAILQGKNFRGKEALAIKMVDALVPAGADVDRFAESYLRETGRASARDAARPREWRGLKGDLPMIQRATLGRPTRARVRRARRHGEARRCRFARRTRSRRDAFVGVAWGRSPEGKAGMRFFFTQQSVQKLPKSFAGKARR